MNIEFRKIFVLLLSLFAVGFAATNPPSDSTSWKGNKLIDFPATKALLRGWLDSLDVGTLAGFNFSDLHYSDKSVNDYSSSIKPNFTFGIFGEYDFDRRFGVRPEFAYVGKGQKIDDGGIEYEMSVHSFDFRIPVLCYLNPIGGNSFYFQAGPYFGIPFGGKITYNDGARSYNTDVSNANVAKCEFGMLLGAGMKRPAKAYGVNFKWGVDISYDLGLTDNYSDEEHDNASYGLNDHYYTINGNRYDRGLMLRGFVEVHLADFLPKKQAKLDAPVVVRTVAKPDTQEKRLGNYCYTIDEIDGMVDRNENIGDKTICMSNLNFEFNKSDLDSSSKKSLDAVVYLLEKAPTMNMRISGHADSIGTEERNMALSQERAKAVYAYLLEKGIAMSRISYSYYGAHHPLVSNNTPEHRALNRRVEFAIFDPSKK